jgi:hypothetical protein
MESEAGNPESVEQKHREQSSAEREKAGQAADPKVFAQSLTQGQTVFAEFAILESPHDEGSQAQKRKDNGF